MLDATHILIGVLSTSVAQLAALIWLGLRLSYRLGGRDAVLTETVVRVDKLEPQVLQLSTDFNKLQGEHNARACHSGR